MDKLKLKKYLCWVNYGSEGWSLSDFDTLEEAVNYETYGMEKIITIKVDYKIEEIIK